MKAKENAIVLLLLLTCVCEARSQISLSAGASYTYEFSYPIVVNFGRVFIPYSQFVPGIAGFDAGDMVRLEMFENSPNEGAFCSVLYGPQTPNCYFQGGGWSDFQGAVRVSVLAGSIEFYGFNLLHAHGAGIDAQGRYLSSGFNESVAVPEPTPLLLLLVSAGICAPFLVFRRVHKYMTPPTTNRCSRGAVLLTFA